MKDVNSLKGIHGAGAIQIKKKRSIPKVQNSTYLDLYVLDKEKERLQKEDERLSMRKDGIRKRLEEIELEMSRIQGAESTTKATKSPTSSGRTFAQTNGPKKEFKTMALTY